MQLKCPRCGNLFETDTVSDQRRIACPRCNARLRLRVRPAVAETDDSGLGPRISLNESSGNLPQVSDSSASGGGTERQPVTGTNGHQSARPPKQKDITLPAGTRLGGFELRRVLGRGGMATVYKATQLSLNRAVAVKVLAARFANNPVFVERFEREAGALANLNHPNIVNIIDKGVSDQLYYFVMELVEGITLDQLLHAVELTERHYVHVVNEISKALTYVHSKGIIHRDIKPSNVLVNRQGGVKVSDFGIAHITDAAMPPERFGRHASIGTAHYMSPEQATAPATVDQRADVYSLAVTFYKMMTRQLPQGAYGTAKAPTLINPKLPRSVDAALLRAMHPDREVRHANVAELCEEVSRCFAASSSGASAVGGKSGDAFSSLFSSNLLAAPAVGTGAAARAFDPTSGGSTGSALYMPSNFGSPTALASDTSASGGSTGGSSGGGAGSASGGANSTPRTGLPATGFLTPFDSFPALTGNSTPSPDAVSGTNTPIGASRFQTASVSAEESAASDSGGSDPGAEDAPPRRRSRWKLALIFLVVIAVLAAGCWGFYYWLHASSYGGILGD